MIIKIVIGFFKKNPRLLIGLIIVVFLAISVALFNAWVGNIRKEAYNSGVASQIALQDKMINDAMKLAIANQEKVRKEYEAIYMDINSSDDNSGACVLVDRVIDRLPDCKSDTCKRP